MAFCSLVKPHGPLFFAVPWRVDSQESILRRYKKMTSNTKTNKHDRATRVVAWVHDPNDPLTVDPNYSLAFLVDHPATWQTEKERGEIHVIKRGTTSAFATLPLSVTVLTDFAALSLMAGIERPLDKLKIAFDAFVANSGELAEARLDLESAAHDWDEFARSSQLESNDPDVFPEGLTGDDLLRWVGHHDLVVEMRAGSTRAFVNSLARRILESEREEGCFVLGRLPAVIACLDYLRRDVE